MTHTHRLNLKKYHTRHSKDEDKQIGEGTLA